NESLDVRIGVPLLAVVFVTAYVNEFVRKESCHLTKKAVEQLVQVFASGIERRIEDSPPAFNLVRPRGACKLGISDQPACHVARHIELGYHANSSFTSIRNHLAHLVLSVKKPV